MEQAFSKMADVAQGMAVALQITEAAFAQAAETATEAHSHNTEAIRRHTDALGGLAGDVDETEN